MKKKLSTFSVTVGIFLFLTAVIVLAVSLFASSTNNRVTARGREGILLTDDDETEWSEDVFESFNMEDIGHDEYVTMGSLNIKNSSPDTRNIFVSLDDISLEDTVTAALFELEVVRDTGDVVYSGTLDVIGEVQFDTLESLEEGFYEWRIKTTRIVEFNEDLDVNFTLVIEGSTQELPSFTDIEADLEDIAAGDMDWGDYDKDGDLDLIVIGYLNMFDGPLTVLYRNEGNNEFSIVSTQFENIAAGTVKWGDFDNDSDLDLLLVGSSMHNEAAKIYRNENNQFIDINANFTSTDNSVADWGDIDNDGDLDVVITGTNSEVYRNENGIFSKLDGSFLGSNQYRTAVDIGDYDNDSFMDIIISITPYSKVYHNEDGVGFTETDISLPGASSATTLWGDYDNDGDLDLFISNKVYRNDNGDFENINASLGNDFYHTVDWGDYDNDGDLDILAASDKNTKIFSFENGIFEEINVNLSDFEGLVAEWGDYNNDGWLDIFLSISNYPYLPPHPESFIYRNNLSK